MTFQKTGVVKVQMCQEVLGLNIRQMIDAALSNLLIVVWEYAMMDLPERYCFFCFKGHNRKEGQQQVRCPKSTF